MLIRKMIIEDYDNIYNLWINTPGIGVNDVDDSKEGISKYLSRNPNTCFVAENNGIIIGAIMSGHDGRRGFIHHTAVELSERRQSIGSQLVDFAIDALKKEGINKVALLAFNKNYNANAFWEKRGFVIREDLTYRNKYINKLIYIDT